MIINFNLLRLWICFINNGFVKYVYFIISYFYYKLVDISLKKCFFDIDFIPLYYAKSRNFIFKIRYSHGYYNKLSYRYS